VRIADVLFRRGHLSEDALTSAVLTGERPEHLEQCAECSRRAREVGLWMSELRAEALAAADEAFPPERLALQHAQILRRLEQVDAPTRVIAFPAQAVRAPRAAGGRRVAPAWVGVAAAAGLVIGVVGGQLSARMTPVTANTPAQVEQPMVPEQTAPAQPINASLLDDDLERYIPGPLLILDQATPTLTQTAAAR
jgi:hypothetical protein